MSLDLTDRPVSAPVVIPYTPRKQFVPIHNSTKRNIWLVAHRRCGKSVFEVNHLLRAAAQNQRKHPPPRYAYIGPSFSQAKDLVWGYLKHYSAPIPGIQVSESDLYVELPTGARVTLYGGAGGYERVRGLYLDGAAMDEYPLLHPSAYSAVVRPALSDYAGFCIISGTSKGRDHFYRMKMIAEANPDSWDVFDLKVYDTDALDPSEVEEARRDMASSDFNREYLNSFDAAVEGAYYSEEIANIYKEKRVTRVPYDPNALVMTAWDLGVSDETTIWYVQRIGQQFHWIDYDWGVGKALPYYCDLVRSKPYKYSGHILPADIMAREFTNSGAGATARRRYDTMAALLPGHTLIAIPQHRIADGINAVRTILPVSWFDETKTTKGMACLSAYQAVRSDKADTQKNTPLHNWASHGADSARTFAMGHHLLGGWSGGTGALGRAGMALKRAIGGIV